MAAATAAAVVRRSFRFAACQIGSTAVKEANLENARRAVVEARRLGADVVCLPEMFNCPYSNDSFAAYAEAAPGGPSSDMLRQVAMEQQVYLIGGSIPERDDDGRLYNTCLVYAPDGRLLAKHRKVHLFDIDIPGQMTFKESLTLSAGGQATSFRVDEFGCAIGVAICYDLRFWELSARMARDLHCDMLVFPGAFNTTTGPLHWELLLRARAVDHQVYVAGVSPSRPADGSGYPAYGHSTVVDPWGKVLAQAADTDRIFVADIDLNVVDQFRQRVPIRHQRRPDAY